MSTRAGLVEDISASPIIPPPPGLNSALSGGAAAGERAIEIGTGESWIVQGDRDAHASGWIVGGRPRCGRGSGTRRQPTVGYEKLPLVEHESPDPLDAVEARVDVSAVARARAGTVDVGAGVVRIGGRDRDAQAPVRIPERRRHGARGRTAGRERRRAARASRAGVERAGQERCRRQREERHSGGEDSRRAPRAPRAPRSRRVPRSLRAPRFPRAGEHLPQATSPSGGDYRDGDLHARRRIGWPAPIIGRLLLRHNGSIARRTRRITGGPPSRVTALTSGTPLARRRT